MPEQFKELFNRSVINSNRWVYSLPHKNIVSAIAAVNRNWTDHIFKEHYRIPQGFYVDLLRDDSRQVYLIFGEMSW